MKNLFISSHYRHPFLYLKTDGSSHWIIVLPHFIQAVGIVQRNALPFITLTFSVMLYNAECEMIVCTRFHNLKNKCKLTSGDPVFHCGNVSLSVLLHCHWGDLVADLLEHGMYCVYWKQQNVSYFCNLLTKYYITCNNQIFKLKALPLKLLRA
jgi:hypothetical protein